MREICLDLHHQSRSLGAPTELGTTGITRPGRQRHRRMHSSYPRRPAGKLEVFRIPIERLTHSQTRRRALQHRLTPISSVRLHNQNVLTDLVPEKDLPMEALCMRGSPKPKSCPKGGERTQSDSIVTGKLVPKKGLEPPHPCEYMDLNHARLPIPPLRHGTLIWPRKPDRQYL